MKIKVLEDGVADLSPRRRTPLPHSSNIADLLPSSTGAFAGDGGASFCRLLSDFFVGLLSDNLVGAVGVNAFTRQLF